MRKPLASTLFIVIWASLACSSGPPSPPSLEYDVPAVGNVSFDVVDTTVVGISLMGQGLELSQRGSAVYAASFAESESGVRVSMSVERLSAVLTQPMGAPVRVDETAVDGDLVFTLDARGDATVVETPEVSAEASQMVSGLATAHSFFPGLPGRAVTPGGNWVDTVHFAGSDGPGSRSETTVLRYTAVGDTTVAGRSLLLISLEGTTSSESEMRVGGMAITQSSELDVTGHVLWDAHAGMLHESVKSATGGGTVSVPIAPGPIPITVRSTRRATRVPVG